MAKPEQNSEKTLHDSLFKWLIDAYITEFFELFFPHIKTAKITDKNKEFLQRFKRKKAPVTADFFLGMEAEVEDQPSDILIILELKSKKQNVQQQIRKYFALAFALEEKPVWAIVLFTDDVKWKKPIANRIPLSFSSEHGFSFLNIDIIKLKDHSAEKLSKHRTLLAKILALKANDHGTDRKTLLREMFRAAAPLQDTLPKHISFLIESFVEAYSNLPPESVAKIKQETNMTVATAKNIGEYYELIGEARGKAIGEARGEARGKREASITEKQKTIAMLEQLKTNGQLDSQEADALITNIKQEIDALQQQPLDDQ